MGVSFFPEVHLTLDYGIHDHYLMAYEVDNFRSVGGMLQHVNVTTNETMDKVIIERDLFMNAVEPHLKLMFRLPFTVSFHDVQQAPRTTPIDYSLFELIDI